MGKIITLKTVEKKKKKEYLEHLLMQKAKKHGAGLFTAYRYVYPLYP